MIFGYLLLAHMLGDFVFQPGRLVAWKIRSRVGIAVHALIHFAIMLLLFLPFFIAETYTELLFIAAISISLLHFCIDAIKIRYELGHDKKVRSFVIDQISHLLIISAAAFFLDHQIPVAPYRWAITAFDQAYSNTIYIFFVVLAIISTRVIEVYRLQLRREHDKNAQLKPNYCKILLRFLIVSLIYIAVADWWYS